MIECGVNLLEKEKSRTATTGEKSAKQAEK